MGAAGGDRRGRESRPMVLRVGLGAVVVGLVGAAVGTSLVVSDESPATTTTTTAPELTGAAAELARLLELRQDQTYHARYEGSSAEAATIVIETWQDEGRVRQDQVLSADGQGAHLVALEADDGPVRCTRLSEQEWACRRAAADDAAVDPVAAIRARLAEGAVSGRDERIDGDTARCFTLLADGTSSDLCVRPKTGIPVRITAGDTELRLVLLEEIVDPAAFVPPGPIT